MSAGTMFERGALALGQARQVPADIHIAAVLYCSLVALVALLAWGRAAGQRCASARKLEVLQQDLSALQSKYDAEVRWRLAGEVNIVEGHQAVVVIEPPASRQYITADQSVIPEETMTHSPQIAMPGANP